MREDFHFTPYSTIRCLLPGPKAGLMHSGKRLYMHLKANLFGWRWFTYNDFSTCYDFSIDDDDVHDLDVIFGVVYPKVSHWELLLQLISLTVPHAETFLKCS